MNFFKEVDDNDLSVMLDAEDPWTPIKIYLCYIIKICVFQEKVESFTTSKLRESWVANIPVFIKFLEIVSLCSFYSQASQSQISRLNF